jgi:hypothetical protein
MKALSRFFAGYAAGLLFMGSWLIWKGDSLESVARLLVLWLPITALYCAVTTVVLRSNKQTLGRLSGMFELCGLCVAAFPLVSGLWPTYMMRWDLALMMIAVQCVALAATMGVVVLVNQIIGSRLKSDGNPPQKK